VCYGLLPHIGDHTLRHEHTFPQLSNDCSGARPPSFRGIGKAVHPHA
jgi:hypothetical protein